MLKKVSSFYLFRWCLLFVCFNVFSQTEKYKSDFVFNDFKSDELLSSVIISNGNILFNASNHKIYSINKENGKINWETYVGLKSDTAPYLSNTNFFFGSNENGILKTAEFNLNTGTKVRDLPFESINTKPFFINNIMYCTVLADGGKLVANDLNENKIIWQKNIGYGSEVHPVYLRDKIIVNTEDDNWFETDYDGNIINTKSKKYTYLDTAKIFVKNYKFLTHDNIEINQDFLRKNKLWNSEYQVKSTARNSFILSEKQLLIIGNGKKKVFQLDLETLIPITDSDFDPYAYRSILEENTESIWFYYQNNLFHYDFKNKKKLRKVDLTQWNPHQVILDGRTIWLISKNNGQLYALDFEPDYKTFEMIKAKSEYYKCTKPDPKMVEAAKVIQEKYKK